MTALLLTALLLACAAGLFLLLRTSMPAPIPPADSALMPQSLNIPRATTAPAGALVQRPLFWQSRLPYTGENDDMPTAPVAANSGTRLDNARLLGMFGSGDTAGVILELNGNRHRILVNEALSGWELIELGDNVATFSGTGNDGATRELTLELSHALVAPGAPQQSRSRFAPARQSGLLPGRTDSDRNNGPDSPDATANNND